MINVHSTDGFQYECGQWYCNLEDSTGEQVGIIEFDDMIAHLCVCRSEIDAFFDFDQYSYDDDDLIDYVKEALFTQINWMVDPKLIEQMIEIVYQDE